MEDRPSPSFFLSLSVCSAHVGNDGSRLLTYRESRSSCCLALRHFSLLSFVALPCWIGVVVGFILFSRRPPWFGRGWAASGPPASPGRGCASESASRPWSRRRRARWCGSGTGGSCRRKPLWRKIRWMDSDGGWCWKQNQVSFNTHIPVTIIVQFIFKPN